MQIHFRTPERPTALIWPINSLLPFRTFDLFFVFLISLSPNPNHNPTQLKSTRLKGGGGPTFCRFYTFFGFFFYNLQLKFEQNLHLQRNPEIYNLQFRQNALKYLNNKKYLQTGFNCNVWGAKWLQVKNNNKDQIKARFWIIYSIATISIATFWSTNLQFL